jgi:hypothetical protein
VLAGAAFAVLSALLLAVAALPDSRHDAPPGPSSSPRQPDATKAVPAACSIAAPASQAPALTPGSPAPKLLDPPADWASHDDPTGYRIVVPDGWTAAGSGPNECFTDPHGGRYVGVGQWRQPDKDMVGYVSRRETQVAAALPDYRKVGITPTDYLDAAAEWEFTFDRGGDKMHARVLAFLASGHRGYAIVWCTYESTWQNNLPDYTRVIGGFQPAQ